MSWQLPDPPSKDAFSYLVMTLALLAAYVWFRSNRTPPTKDIGDLTWQNHPAPHENFDLKTARVRDWIFENKPLRYPYHQTMSHRPMEIEDWMEITSDYQSDLRERQSLIQEHGEKVLQSLPENDFACQELLLALIEWLPRRYPELFNVATDLLGISNRITGEEWEWTEGDLPSGCEALKVISRLVQADFLMARERQDGHVYCVGGLVVYPGSYLLSDQVGRNINEIHTVIPHSNRIVSSIERALKRLEPEAPFERSSWLITDDDNRFRHNVVDLPETEQVSVSPENMYLRLDRQTFRKLPKSRVVAFGIHPHLAQLKTFVDTPLIPALLYKIHSESSEELLDYKDAVKYWSSLKIWLESVSKHQLDAGLVDAEDRVQDFRKYYKGRG